MTRRRRTLVVLALVLPALLSGCFASKETRQGSDRLIQEYDEDLPGVAEVRVESGVEGIADDYVQTVISLLPDATVDDVVPLIVDHPAKAERSGLADNTNLRRLRIEYGTDKPTLTMEWVGQPEETAIRAGVEHWFSVISLVGPHVQLVLGTDGSELYGVQNGEVAAAYRTLATDPGLSAGTADWDVTSTDTSPELRLATSGLPSEKRLSAWDELVSALGMLPSSAAATRLDVSIAARATVDVYLTGPISYGKDKDRLWPGITHQLDAVPDLAKDWGYFLSAAPAGNPDSVTIELSLLSHAKPVDNHDDSTKWSQAAYDYIHARRDGP